MSSVAVFDVGKTNLKLSVAGLDGHLFETLTCVNPSRPGPPYRHHDLDATERWLADGLRELGARHRIDAFVTSAHGSGGVLVDDDGPAMPMVDYEQSPPEAVDRLYAEVVGSFLERGSPILLGVAHLARQMLWLETGWPEAFGRARFFLAVPQYWAWRLSGMAAAEVTSLAAQSHLWSSAERRLGHIVDARGWRRLIPPFASAWESLGTITPDWAARTGLPATTRILCGIHDSSANIYRYQAAGLKDMTVVSTGTWIVAMSDRLGVRLDVEQPGLCCNADVDGRPMPAILTMGGREFSAVAGEGLLAPASLDALDRIVASGTMALPTFGADDTLFPGTARRGAIVGPLAADASCRTTLGVLYAALLTDRCLASLNGGRTNVLDGSFVRDPLYGQIIAALDPGRHVLVNLDRYGLASGAALLASHETRREPAPLSLLPPAPLDVPNLDAYRSLWRDRAQHQEQLA